MSDKEKQKLREHEKNNITVCRKTTDKKWGSTWNNLWKNIGKKTLLCKTLVLCYVIRSIMSSIVNAATKHIQKLLHILKTMIFFTVKIMM